MQGKEIWVPLYVKGFRMPKKKEYLLSDKKRVWKNQNKTNISLRDNSFQSNIDADCERRMRCPKMDGEHGFGDLERFFRLPRISACASL